MNKSMGDTSYLQSKISRICGCFLAALTVLFFVFSLFLTWYVNFYQQFTYLARSFIAGKVYFLTKPGDSWIDVVYYHGRHYWPLGPAPAVILIPFVWIFDRFGFFFRQGYLQIPLLIGVFTLCYLLARRYKFIREDAWYLAFAFCFASPYVMSAYLHWSWFYVQAIVVFFLFLSIYEWHGKKRYWLIGLYYAVVIASRFTAALTVLFFIADIVSNKNATLSIKIRQLSMILVPIIVTGLMLLWYNFVRFGNAFDNGYLSSGNMSTYVYFRFEQLHYGLFHLKNIPTNFYYYFIKTVDPVLVEHYSGNVHSYILTFPYITIKNPGINFFASSPIFLFIFVALRRPFRIRIVWMSLIPICVVFALLLMFYWPGMKQVGPRYTLDFLPFLYLILLQSFEKYRLPPGAKMLIVSSAFLDFLLFITIVTNP